MNQSKPSNAPLVGEERTVLKTVMENSKNSAALCECNHEMGHHWHRASGVEECGIKGCGCTKFSLPVGDGAATETATAREIVTRIVENTVRLLWSRNIEPLQDDEDAEFPTEDELLIDALAFALGDDIGCLDEKDEDFRERIDLLWLEDKLASQPSLPIETRESKIEYELVAVRNWLSMHLENHVEHREPKRSSSVNGTDGWAVVAIPDWDARQRLERINEAMLPAAPKPDEGE